MHRGEPDTDAGETLVETVISLMMFGLAGLMILGSLGAGSLLSADHRKLTVSDVAVKAATEAVKAATYVPGAGDDAYDSATSGVPSGYAVTVGPVRCWPGGAATSVSLSTFVPCGTTEAGLQAVTVSVRSEDGVAEETTTVLKRESP